MVLNRYNLRSFDSANLSDIERANLMYFHPKIMKAKGYWEPRSNYTDEIDLKYVDRKLFETKTILTKKHDNMLFAVADRRDKLVGWIWFYREASNPLPMRVMTELKVTGRNAWVYQVSYEKLLSEGWPVKLVAKAETVKLRQLQGERKGVIMYGLQKAVMKLARMKRKLSGERKRVIIYAYTYPRNIASEKVLLQSGFEKYWRQYSYGGDLHNLWLKVI